MFVKITSKRQVTFPAKVLESLGVQPGDQLELLEGPDGYLIRARRLKLEKLATLQGKLRRGQGTFNLEHFRAEPYDPSLRD